MREVTAATATALMTLAAVVAAQEVRMGPEEQEVLAARLWAAVVVAETEERQATPTVQAPAAMLVTELLVAVHKTATVQQTPVAVVVAAAARVPAAPAVAEMVAALVPGGEQAWAQAAAVVAQITVVQAAQAEHMARAAAAVRLPEVRALKASSSSPTPLRPGLVTGRHMS